MVEQIEREKFRDWATDVGDVDLEEKSDEMGLVFASMETHLAWMAWKEGRADLRQEWAATLLRQNELLGDAE